MVDFRARRDPALRQALIRAKSQEAAAPFKGIQEGIQLGEAISNIAQRRKQAKLMAQALKQYEGQPAKQAAFTQNPVATLKLEQEQKAAASAPEILPVVMINPITGELKTPEGKVVTSTQITPGKTKIINKKMSTKEEAERKAILVEADAEARLGFKRKTLAKDIDTFLVVDESIMRGKGAKRFLTGLESKRQGFLQNTARGRAVATHDAAAKRLRVQLVRAAGDVGNINIVEQEAAEKIIPSIFDDVGTAKIKRAFLKQLVKAVENRDSNEVQKILGSAGVTTSARTEQQQGLSGISDEELLEGF